MCFSWYSKKWKFIKHSHDVTSKKPISVCKISFLNLSCFSWRNFSDWIKSLKERGMILIKRHKKVVFEMSSLSLARVCNFYCKRAPYLGVGQCFTVIEDTQIDKKTRFKAQHNENTFHFWGCWRCSHLIYISHITWTDAAKFVDCPDAWH